MKRALTMALCLGMGWAGGVFAAQTTRHVVLVSGGKQAGQQLVTRADDGTVSVEYRFKDNGRGPELLERYTLAADGTYREYRVQGATTFGAGVDETFRRSGGRARWKTTSDAGEQAVSGSAMYMPLGGTPQGLSVALQALAKRPDGRLPLLPDGALTARELTRVTAQCGGTPREARLMAVSGVGLTPNFGWVTAENELFAFIVPGYLQMLEAGCEADGTVLEEAQKRAEAELLLAMAKRHAKPLPGSTLIRNARVFDSEHARLGGASDVLLRDGRIVSVAPAGGQVAADRVIDAAGRVLLPGLFDMHAHVGRWDGGLNLASGVTTVRDMGNDNANIRQMREELAAGTLLGPDIVPAGFIEGESEFASRSDFVVKDVAGAKEAIDFYAANGYPQIKIYNSFPKEALQETVDYAHSRGLRVSGHVPAFLRAQDVVDAGYDEIQHINQLLLNFFVDETTDTRTLQRFYLVAEKTAGLDLDSAPVQAFIAELARKQIVIDPTLATFEFLHQRNGQRSPLIAGVAAHLPPGVVRQRSAAEMDIADDATGARYKRSYDKLVEFVGRAYRAGVPVVAGTDEIAGFTLQRELELLVQAGLSPSQALQVATWNGAKYSGALDERGSIAPGKRADLVLVDGDPTREIADIRKAVLVIKGGAAYAPAELHRELGIRPFAAPLRVGGE